jgi:hypothetical protein
MFGSPRLKPEPTWRGNAAAKRQRRDDHEKPQKSSPAAAVIVAAPIGALSAQLAQAAFFVPLGGEQELAASSEIVANVYDPEE